MPISAAIFVHGKAHRWSMRSVQCLRGTALGYLTFLSFCMLFTEPASWIPQPSSSGGLAFVVSMDWLSNDKVQHAAAYGIFSVLAVLGARWPTPTVLAIAACHGGAMELLQYWTPRTPEWLDWMSDLGGTAVVLLGYRFLFRRWP
jgi:hypothetical protein